MTKYFVLFAVALLVVAIAAPAMAARTSAIVPVVHPTMNVYQAYAGSTAEGTVVVNGEFQGAVVVGDNITAVPGVFTFLPGDKWANFVEISTNTSTGYDVKNVVLKKTPGSPIQCNTALAALPVTQQGTPKIRTWWPLAFEIPGTKFVLTVNTGSYIAIPDSANTAPTTLHQDVWTWVVDVNFESLRNTLDLFSELPFGLHEVPLLSDNDYRDDLKDLVTAAETAYLAAQAATDENMRADYYAAADDALVEFESLLMDKFVGDDIAAGKVGQFVVQTTCYPVWCKLLADVEYLGMTNTDIWQQTK